MSASDNLQLEAAEIQSYIYDAELPRRRADGWGQAAEEVLRYGSFVGSTLECHVRLGRAMEHARLYIDSQEKRGRSVQSGRLILAGTLTGSKGRFTRSWHAPDGGLWGCLLHGTTLTAPSTLLLSLALGVAACEAIRQVGVNDCAVRWVNDVLVRGEKVAGFLVESHTGPRWKELFHLIGFGINVNNQVFPEELENWAASIAQALGASVNLPDFTLDFTAKLAWNIGMLYYIEARHPDWWKYPSDHCHPVLARWRKLSDTLGQRVVFGYDVIEKPQFTARVAGVSSDGGLRLVLDDGREITEYSGEIRYI